MIIINDEWLGRGGGRCESSLQEALHNQQLLFLTFPTAKLINSVPGQRFDKSRNYIFVLQTNGVF